jgi:hypothetical protein
MDLFRHSLDNWISRIYLAVVAVTLVFVGVDTLFVSHADASMSAVVPVLLTAPESLVLLLTPDGVDGWAFGVAYVAVVVVSALANAAFLGALLRRLRSSVTA